MTAEAIAPPLHPTRGLNRGVGEFLNDRVGFLAATRATGPVVRLEVGPPVLRNSIYVVHTAAAAETVFSARTAPNFRKDNTLYQEFRQVLGNGILTAQDDEWLRQKRFVQPVFTRARVDGYLRIMLEEIEALAAQWRGLDEVDLHAAMTHLTLRIVGRVLFGEELDELEEVISAEFPIAQHGILKRAALGGKVPLSWPLSINRATRAAQQSLYDVVDRITASRRASGERGEDLISLLLNARDGDERLTDSEVRDQILIFLLAGHETTSAALTFALHLLGRHPEVQQQVRDEVRAVGGGAPLTAAQMHSGLPVATAALQEAMRMYPAAPFVGRRLSQDCVVDGYAIPGGSDTVASIWSIHHDPELWPEPDTFRPERFLEGEPANRYAWMPFGAGPRACIGQHFSMLESVAALAMLVGEFEIESRIASDHVPVNSAVTLFPTRPVLAGVRAAG
ncbi:MAG TPA: cytochrome P450 [Nocardioides sp.]|nr:cytochrome P450 [Nocardioides sp.]